MGEIPWGMKLSVAYDKMMKLRCVRIVRRANDEIMQYHFEKATGMITEEQVQLRVP
jgi:uncharacterized protein YlbG (UPF0298 family)